MKLDDQALQSLDVLQTERLYQLAAEMKCEPWELLLVAAGEPWPLISPLETLDPKQLEARMLAHYEVRNDKMLVALHTKHLIGEFAPLAITLEKLRAARSASQSKSAHSPRYKVAGDSIKAIIRKVMAKHPPESTANDLWTHFIAALGDEAVEGVTENYKLQVTFRSDADTLRTMTKNRFATSLSEIRRENLPW